MIDDERKHKILRRIHRDPVFFAEEVLGVALWSKQQEILGSVAKRDRTVVKSAHSTGKTFSASILVVWYLLTRKPCTVVTTAPTNRQCKLLWREIRARWNDLPAALRRYGEAQKTQVQMLNEDGSEAPRHLAFTTSTDDPEKLQGIHNKHIMVVVDEAAKVADDIYVAIDSLSAGGTYRELLIGNPTRPEGRFHGAFQRYDYHAINIPAEACPAWTGEEIPDYVAQELLTPERAERFARDWGRDSVEYTARVKAEFPEVSGEPTLVAQGWWEDVSSREPDTGAPHVVQIGVDVARFGTNRNSLAVRTDNELWRLDTLEGATTMPHVASWVRTHAQEVLSELDFPGPLVVLIDEGGVGGGLLDILQEDDERNVLYFGVPFGGAPYDDTRFVCRRDELYWDVRDYCEPENGQPNLVVTAENTDGEIDRLGMQLTNVQYEYDSKGRIKLESKRSMKQDGRPSPDEADSVALAFTRPPEPDAEKKQRLTGEDLGMETPELGAAKI